MIPVNRSYKKQKARKRKSNEKIQKMIDAKRRSKAPEPVAVPHNQEDCVEPGPSGTSAAKKISRSAEKLQRASKEGNKHEDSDISDEEANSSEEEGNSCDETEYRLVQTGALKKIFSSFPCKVCKQTGTLDVEFSCVRGFSSKMRIICTSCDEEQTSEYTSPSLPSGGIDINRRMVEAFISMGLNHSGAQKLGVAVNLHVPARKNFNRYRSNP